MGFLFQRGDRLVLTFEFWREEHLRKHPDQAGMVLVAALSADEFAETLDRLIEALGRGREEAPGGFG